jgi:putative ABC transport system permease protein
MRFTDLLVLPVAALWQQKSRTALTTLGVVFGSFVLAASLSINQGVQDTIERESHRTDVLRRISVQPEWDRVESDVPADEVVVEGEMNDARRERIRKTLAAEKMQYRANKPRLPLSPETLERLARIEHVELVIPMVHQYGQVVLEHRPHGADVGYASPDDAASIRRLVAGRFFESPAEPAVVVSEYLLYRLGFTDDASIDGTVGKILRLELRPNFREPELGVYLSKAEGELNTPEETAAVDEIKKRLPDSLELFNLSAEEIALLRKTIDARSPDAATEYVAEFPIIGIVRLATEEELKKWDSFGANSNVILPYQTAADVYFSVPSHVTRGLNQATVRVDRDENARKVFEQIKGMGLGASALLEFIERERFMNLMIFGAMTCVAAVALLVAALGIANTMLMSVLERTREIGIMKAVGASGPQLVFIFLVEGAMIGLVGGGLGLLLAWGASFPGDDWIRSNVASDIQVYLTEAILVFPLWLVVVVLLFATLVTTLAAVYPARRAASIDPVAALRHE